MRQTFLVGACFGDLHLHSSLSLHAALSAASITDIFAEDDSRTALFAAHQRPETYATLAQKTGIPRKEGTPAWL